MTAATTTLNVRGIDRATVDALKAAAAARRLTLAAYLARLARLHLAMRALADDGNMQVAGELDAIGLATVSA